MRRRRLWRPRQLRLGIEPKPAGRGFPPADRSLWGGWPLGLRWVIRAPLRLVAVLSGASQGDGVAQAPPAVGASRFGWRGVTSFLESIPAPRLPPAPAPPEKSSGSGFTAAEWAPMPFTRGMRRYRAIRSPWPAVRWKTRKRENKRGNWCSGQDSNLQPSDPKSEALSN